MRQQDWQGVLPAITTPFTSDLAVDHPALKEHVAWLAAAGSKGIVALGSLGEGATLSYDEKIAVLKSCRAGLGGGTPLVAGIAALSTAEAVSLARDAE
jgi:4-hydroxy-tetrahydrodipicolinate synthase